MCGIAGYIDRTIESEEVILAMMQKMLHRGPDAGGHFRDDESGVTLGHRRLSIIDLSENGAQPMTSASGRYVIVYNGEIYNTDEVKKKAQQKEGFVKLRGTSDTEVILEAFESVGIEETLEIMKGMFAIALFDRKEKELYLMRDRAGEKPLYYGFVKGHFVFASDLAVLDGYPAFREEKQIRRQALADYMRYGFIPAPYSIYEGIYKLLPGGMLKTKAPFEPGSEELSTYYCMKDAALRGQRSPFTGSFEEACDELEELLSKSIRGQMISDVPIGAFLSGGIDSPLIVSLMQKISPKPVRTFTIGFEDPKYNEAEFAKDIAEHLGTDHTEMYVTEKELLEVIPRLSEIFTEPFADSSQIPTYLLSRLTKENVTVSLSGDAGDELFCGYNTYAKVSSLWGKVKKIPRPIRSAAAGMALALPYGKGAKGFRLATALKAGNIKQFHEAICYHTDYYGEHCVPGLDVTTSKDMASLYDVSDLFLEDDKNNMLYKDMVTYHPDDILVKVDRAGMAVSLENRVPMLDRDVMEFAFSLPMEYKYKDGVSKRILKEILYRHVPKEMLDRPKKGFSVPLRKWLTTGQTAQWAKELITGSTLVRDGYFEKKAVDKMWKEFLSEKADAQMVWQLLMAEAWYRQWG